MTLRTNTHDKKEEDIVLTLDEAADRLKVSKWTVNKLIQERKLGSIKIGARRLVPTSDLESFVQRERENGGTYDR